MLTKMFRILEFRHVLAVFSVVGVFCLTEKSEFQDNGQYRSYAGHQLLRVYPNHPKDFQKLKLFEQDQSKNIDFWQRPTFSKRNVDLLVAPEDGEMVKKMMKDAGLEMTVVSNDIQKLIDEEFEQRSDNAVSKRSSRTNSLHQYQSYGWMMEWMEDVAEKCKFCDVINIGKSSEGRLLKVLKITKSKTRKPAIFIDAGFHAREWIGPITALNFIEALGNETDSVMSFLTSEFVWYILPIANPDGYVYSWTKDRLWRKTRSRHGRDECVGTDMNRNWDFFWGAGEGTSKNSCRENYCGPKPFSEPESQAIADFILDKSSDMIIYLSLHSYGQLILLPWGYTTEVPHDFYDLLIRGTDAAEAMRKSTGVRYAVGSTGRMLYLASGASDDWVKGVAKVKYSFTMELRDMGNRGFLLPETEISDTSLEVTNGIVKMSLDIHNELKTYGSKYVVIFHEDKTEDIFEPALENMMYKKENVQESQSTITNKITANDLTEDFVESHENKEIAQNNVEDQFNNDFKYEINKDKLNIGDNVEEKSDENVETIDKDKVKIEETIDMEDDSNAEEEAQQLEMAAIVKLKQVLEDKLKLQRHQQYLIMKRLQDEIKKQDLWNKQKSMRHFQDIMADKLKSKVRYYKQKFFKY